MGEMPEATEKYNEITASNTGRDANSLHQLLHLRLFNEGIFALRCLTNIHFRYE
jgi:hypothetical protein